MDNFTQEELEEALRSITSTTAKCEKVLPKLKQGIRNTRFSFAGSRRFRSRRRL